MKVSPLWATVVAGWFSALLFAAPVVAQVGRPAVQPAASGGAPSNDVGTRVAVIDVAKIFKHHARFNGKMQEIKNEIEQFEAHIQAEQKRFNQLRESLTSFTPGSHEYKQKEADLAKMQSEMQLSIGLKKKDFLEREASVYYTIYGEIEQSVTLFAQRYRIGIVLRYNGEAIKADDRNSILQGVNKAVVWVDPGIDITDHILRELNAGAMATPTPRPPVIPGPVQQ